MKPQTPASHNYASLDSGSLLRKLRSRRRVFFNSRGPVLFVIGDSAIYGSGIGWYAGYVICDQTGIYTLHISANGPEKLFPVTNTKVIVCISDERKKPQM